MIVNFFEFSKIFGSVGFEVVKTCNSASTKDFFLYFFDTINKNLLVVIFVD